jgi:hypothetical protein
MLGRSERPRRWVRVAGNGSVFLLTTLFALYFAYFVMFSLLQPYDDEGYILISLEGFLGGGSLYDHVYSQYGPLFYVLMGGLFKGFGLQVTHDTGRIATWLVWVGTTLLCGLVVLRLTRILAIAVGAQLLALATLYPMVNEPMHPGGLVAMLVITLIATSSMLLRHRPSLAMLGTGAALAGAALVKVNVGAFAIISFGFACTVAFPALSRFKAMRFVAGIAMVSAPLVLMRSDLGQDWGRRYALLVALSGLAVILATSAQPTDKALQPVHLAWAFAGASTVAAVVFAITLFGGTSVGGLAEGALVGAFRQPRIFTLPLPLPPGALYWAGLGAAIAALVGLRRRRASPSPRTFLVAAVARIGTGILIWLAVAGTFVPGTAPFSFALPLAWVAAVPPKGIVRSEWSTFVRTLLPSLAVLQTLHAYPVAGSQLGWSSVPMIPVGAVCIADGIAQFVASGQKVRGRRLTLAFVGVSRIPALLFAGWMLFQTLLPRVPLILQSYRAEEPLNLPGAERLHVPPDQALAYRGMSKALARRCSTFVSLPGLNSFYFFAELDPPTWMNTTHWTALLDAEVQQRIVEAVDGVEELCILRDEGLQSGWARGRPVPRRPLFDYIQGAFTPVERYGSLELLVRNRGGVSA